MSVGRQPEAPSERARWLCTSVGRRCPATGHVTRTRHGRDQQSAGRAGVLPAEKTGEFVVGGSPDIAGRGEGQNGPVAYSSRGAVAA